GETLRFHDSGGTTCGGRAARRTPTDAKGTDVTQSPRLPELEHHDDFVARHIGPGPDEQAAMLATLGLSSLAELIERVVPESIRWDKPLDLPGPVSETEALDCLRALADANVRVTSLIGCGYHD